MVLILPDDGTTDRDTPVAQAHLASSFGLTFCVSNDAKKLRVEAAWGQYLREVKPLQIDERTGRPKRIWKRYPRGGVIEIPLTDGTVRQTSFDANSPDVFVRGKIWHRNTHWIVTLFLVNGQLLTRVEIAKGADRDRCYQTGYGQAQGQGLA